MHLTLKIERCSGVELKTLIDSFYARNAFKGMDRNDDLFFLGLENHVLIACVRYCEEEGYSLLRTMVVDQTARKKGMGTWLLSQFTFYLDEHNIRDVYCLPYEHLESFYATGGFKKVESRDIPAFLAMRLEDYANNGEKTICMKRR